MLISYLCLQMTRMATVIQIKVITGTQYPAVMEAILHPCRTVPAITCNGQTGWRMPTGQACDR